MIWFRQSKKTKLRKALRRIEETEKKLKTQQDFFKLKIANTKFRVCSVPSDYKKVEREIAGAEYRLTLIEKQMKYLTITRETVDKALNSQDGETKIRFNDVVSYEDGTSQLKTKRKETHTTELARLVNS